MDVVVGPDSGTTATTAVTAGAISLSAAMHGLVPMARPLVRLTAAPAHVLTTLDAVAPAARIKEAAL